MSLLAYLFAAAPFVIVILIALGLVFLTVTSTINVWVPLVLLYLVLVIDTASLHSAALKLGLLVYPADLAAAIFFFAFLYRVFFLGKGGLVPRAWWILGAVQMGLFVWGLAQNGTGAGVDYRQHFYVWIGAAYLATFEYDAARAQRFMRWLLPLAIALSCVAIYRWIMGAMDWQFQSELDRLITTGISFRVIWAAPTFMIAMAMLVAIYYAITDRGKFGYWFWVLTFGMMVLVLQHRSVWAAALVGVGVLVFLLTRHQAGKMGKVLFLGFALFAIVSIGLTSLKGVSESVQTQSSRAFSVTEGTFAGRVGGWQFLLKDWLNSGSPITYLVGKPFGSGYSRYSSNFGGHEVGYVPHNYYVHLLYRGGLVGMLCFLWVVWFGVRAIWVRIKQGDDFAPLQLAMTIALLVYYIPYGVAYDQILIMGLLLSVIAPSREVARLPHLSQSVPSGRGVQCSRM